MTRIANNGLTKARDAADAALLYKKPEYTATQVKEVLKGYEGVIVSSVSLLIFTIKNLIK